jgi:NADH-quinone oxidoreductase subunit M
MNSIGPLTLLTALPIAGAVLVLILKRAQKLSRAVAIVIAVAALLATLVLWARFDSAAPGMQFQEVHTWAPSVGLTYHVGVDGLGILLLVLSAVVVLMSLAASWRNASHGPVYFALVLLLEAGLFGTFTALNFLHWFIFWELTLLPAFFLVRLWGGPQRGRASVQFFFYTMVGSVALLLAFLALYLATGTYDFTTLAQMAQNGGLAAALQQNLHWGGWSGGHIALILFWAVFLGFAVKTPVVPFHGWLPDTYSEASSETTMLLTGAMSKMGIFGFLRILLPIFPAQMQEMLTPLLWLAVASIVLPAFAAWRQKDLKRTFAYSSVNHLGYCVLGVCVAAKLTGVDPSLAIEKSAALTGVLLQIFSHGLTAAALFWFVALLERRSGGLRGLEDFGGLRKIVPVFCGLMGIAIFASLGLPGLNGFPAEFLIFKGAFPLAGWAATAALLGLLLTAVFLLGILQKVFFGPLGKGQLETKTDTNSSSLPAAMRDLSTTERFALAPAIALMFVLGLYPQLIAGKMAGTVTQWTTPATSATEAYKTTAPKHNAARLEAASGAWLIHRKAQTGKAQVAD